jgi:hypothetical protein
MDGQFVAARLIPVSMPISEWTSLNPVLRQGELGMEVGVVGATKMKLGDGVTPYLSLPYAFTGGSGGSGDLDAVCHVGNFAYDIPVVSANGANTKRTYHTDTSFVVQADALSGGSSVAALLAYDSAATINKPFLQMRSGDLAAFFAILYANTLTADREHKLPDEDGVLVTHLTKDTFQVARSTTGVTIDYDGSARAQLAGNPMWAFSSGGTGGVFNLYRNTLGAYSSIKCNPLITGIISNTTPNRNGSFAISGDGVAPSILAGPAVDTAGGGSVSIVSGDDRSHVITFTTGTTPIAGVIFTLTYSQAYDIAPRVVFSAGNLEAAQIAIPKCFTDDFVTNKYQFNAGAALDASTTYIFIFSVAR